MAYTQQQTVFFLSMLSNLAITQKGTVDQLEQYLAQHIDAHLSASQDDIGAWMRVWGPAVFQAPLSNVADNVMYVACNGQTPPQYVVAVAGTNYNSVFDILIEDAFVSQQVPWAYGNPPAGTAISAGTFAGLTVLQFLRPGPAMPGGNQSLADFLESAATQSMQVITTGHSLGGALSPALALWLSNTQSSWDRQGRAALSCEPTAGPTPGNAGFAQYYDQVLGGRTTRIYNSLDIVPHAWNDTSLSALPALYEPDIAPDIWIYALVDFARYLAQERGYTQIAAGTPPLTGTIDTAIIDPASSAFENYLEQAGYQHIDAYFALLQVTIGSAAMAAVRTAMGAPAALAAAPRLQAKLERRNAVPAGVK